MKLCVWLFFVSSCAAGPTFPGMGNPVCVEQAQVMLCVWGAGSWTDPTAARYSRHHVAAAAAQTASSRMLSPACLMEGILCLFGASGALKQDSLVPPHAVGTSCLSYEKCGAVCVGAAQAFAELMMNMLAQGRAVQPGHLGCEEAAADDGADFETEDGSGWEVRAQEVLIVHARLHPPSLIKCIAPDSAVKVRLPGLRLEGEDCLGCVGS